MSIVEDYNLPNDECRGDTIGIRSIMLEYSGVTDPCAAALSLRTSSTREAFDEMHAVYQGYAHLHPPLHPVCPVDLAFALTDFDKCSDQVAAWIADYAVIDWDTSDIIMRLMTKACYVSSRFMSGEMSEQFEQYDGLHTRAETCAIMKLAGKYAHIPQLSRGGLSSRRRSIVAIALLARLRRENSSMTLDEVCLQYAGVGDVELLRLAANVDTGLYFFRYLLDSRDFGVEGYRAIDYVIRATAAEYNDAAATAGHIDVFMPPSRNMFLSPRVQMSLMIACNAVLDVLLERESIDRGLVDRMIAGECLAALLTLWVDRIAERVVGLAEVLAAGMCPIVWQTMGGVRAWKMIMQSVEAVNDYPFVHFACRSGYGAMLDQLSSQVDVNARDAHGRNAFAILPQILGDLRLIDPKYEIVDTLMRVGVSQLDVDGLGTSVAVLFVGAAHMPCDVVRAVLDRGDQLRELLPSGEPVGQAIIRRFGKRAYAEIVTTIGRCTRRRAVHVEITTAEERTRRIRNSRRGETAW